MSLWTLLEGGMSMPSQNTRGRAFSSAVGRWLASRRRGVSIDKTCLISPEAKICARDGKVQIGPRSSVAAGACVQGQVTIGENCSVQMYTILCGYPSAGITIGNNVRIAAHTMMVSGNHRFQDRKTPICKQGLDCKPIVIEDDVWVASRVNIMAGVRVGRGSVLAAGCVVTHDVPPYSVMAGVPAKCIGMRGTEN